MKTGTRSLAVFNMLLLAAGCRANNVVLGRVEAHVDGHQVAVTDCYRMSVPTVEETRDSLTGATSYNWAPCKDAVIAINGESLTVNGTRYDKLVAGDSVVVDHGKVLVNGKGATPRP